MTPAKASAETRPAQAVQVALDRRDNGGDGVAVAGQPPAGQSPAGRTPAGRTRQ